MITHYTPGQQIHYTNPNVCSVVSRALGPNVIIRDEFTGADGILLPAHAISPVNIPVTSWLNIAGAGGIASNRATSTTNVNAQSECNAGVSDCTLSAILRIGGAIAYSRLAYRSSGNIANLWIAGINGNTQVLDIYEITTGVTTLRASTPMVVAINTDYTLSLVLSGASMVATIGAATVSYSSAVRQTATRHGVFVSRNGIGGGFVDNFQVTA